MHTQITLHDILQVMKKRLLYQSRKNQNLTLTQMVCIVLATLTYGYSI